MRPRAQRPRFRFRAPRPRPRPARCGWRTARASSLPSCPLAKRAGGLVLRDGSNCRECNAAHSHRDRVCERWVNRPEPPPAASPKVDSHQPGNPPSHRLPDTVGPRPVARSDVFRASHPVCRHRGLRARGGVPAGSNTVLLALVVEKVSGLPFGEDLRQNSFAPARLSRTSSPDNRALPGPRTHGYVVLPDGPVVDATFGNPPRGPRGRTDRHGRDRARHTRARVRPHRCLTRERRS